MAIAIDSEDGQVFANPADRARRRLSALSPQIAELRQRLLVLDEQITFLSQVAADAQTDAVVTENPSVTREHQGALRDVARARRERDEVAKAVADHLAEQDRLLDSLL
ncbi:MAG: hypothetical protein ACR2HR_02860 [Euzebya sp.]